MTRLHRPIALVLAALLAACSDPEPREYGEAVVVDAAVPLSRLLERKDVGPDETVTVSGRIGEVCTSAGCWFVLEEVSDGKVYDVMTDLTAAAGFTVPLDVRGREAVVTGRMVAREADLELQAVGLRVE